MTDRHTDQVTKQEEQEEKGEKARVTEQGIPTFQHSCN